MSDSKKKSKQPVLKLPLTNVEKVIEIISAIGIFLIFIIVIISWNNLPEKIPTHFGSSGAPDGWGGKASLVLLPIGTIFLYMIMSFASKYPHTFNYPWKITEDNAKDQYQIARYLMGFLKVEVIWSFTYIQWKTIQVALGKATGLGIIYLPITLISIFGTIAVYFYKAREYK